MNISYMSVSLYHDPNYSMKKRHTLKSVTKKSTDANPLGLVKGRYYLIGTSTIGKFIGYGKKIVGDDKNESMVAEFFEVVDGKFTNNRMHISVDYLIQPHIDIRDLETNLSDEATHNITSRAKRNIETLYSHPPARQVLQSLDTANYIKGYLPFDIHEAISSSKRGKHDSVTARGRRKTRKNKTRGHKNQKPQKPQKNRKN
jgi:hypothetical protein